jgi:hypothetical protein
MYLDRFEQPVSFCEDPSCEWAALPDTEHFARHNPNCAELFIATDGSEMLCELLRGHEGAHRGIRHDLRA